MIGNEFIVACLVPDAISPHPNFSVEEVSPSALVALLAECRFADYQRFQAKSGDLDNERRLVSAIFESLVAGSLEEGIASLTLLCSDQSLSIGGRVAAGLFMSNALAEIDQPDSAVQRLETLLRAVESFAGDTQLAEGALSQQLVLRLVECDRRDEAAEQARHVLRILSPALRLEEPLATSKGFRGGRHAAYSDAVSTLRSHAQSALAVLEPMGGRAWVSVVKGRLPRPDVRAVRNVARGGSAFIDRQVELQLSWARRRRQLLSSDPVMEPAQSAVLQAELTGDLGVLRQRRELLGRLCLLDRQDTSWALPEAIRLLRQSDSKETLEDAVQWLRGEGPIDLLRDSARQLLGSRPRQFALTQCDLVVVSAASDLLDQHELRAGVDACLAFRDNPRSGRVSGQRLVGWSAAEFAWRATSRLLPASGMDNRIASDLLDFVQSPWRQLDIAVGALIRTADAIDWSLVSDESQVGLREWAMNLEETTASALAFVVLDAIDGVSRHDARFGRPVGLELAARLLREKAADIPALRTELDLAVEACIENMAKQMESADRGQYQFGGLNGAELAVLLAVVFDEVSLWPHLRQYLLHPRVSTSDKAPVFDRMARLARSGETIHLADLGDAAAVWLREQVEGVFASPDLGVVPEALRFLLAMRSLPIGRAMPYLLELAGSPTVEGRVEAARCLAYASEEGDGEPDWVAVLLLQLTHDRNAAVRAEAGEALPRFWRADRATSTLIAERIATLLASDGVVVPLLTLRGLVDRPALAQLLAAPSLHLLVNHPSRMIRTSAKELIASAF